MTIHTGDCIEVMAAMDADSVDAIVTDPPYGLEFMGKEWDSFKSGAAVFHDPSKLGGFQDGNGGNAFSRSRVQFHNGLKASQSFQAWCEAWGREALRVAKPGGYLLAFGGTRTHHRLVCGLEDAGWIIRDELDWIYASGFPKGKANLKPAHEPIVLARKPGPLQALRIDECRIPSTETWEGGPTKDNGGGVWDVRADGTTVNEQRSESHPNGRWPSNVLLSDPALFDDKNAEVVGSGATATTGGDVFTTRQGAFGGEWTGEGPQFNSYGDSGGYSRFFIIPKADRADREPVVRGQLALSEELAFDDFNRNVGNTIAKPRENQHPTVKPVDLMRHLVRLVTPLGGTVLDPFLGSGSTAIAAELEGFPWIGIEKEPEYVAIAEARLHGTQRGLGLDVPAPTRKQAGKWDDNATAKRHETPIRDPYAFWGERERPPVDPEDTA